MSMHHVIELFAPWQAAYSDSKTIATSVAAVHLVSMFLGGGLAIAADRSTLRAFRGGATDRARMLSELHGVHRPVLIALSVMFVSGLMLATADLETFLGSPVFWVKLGLVALLVANGGVLALTEKSLRRTDAALVPARSESLWRRLRTSAVCSLALWTATVLAGVVLVNAA